MRCSKDGCGKWAFEITWDSALCRIHHDQQQRRDNEAHEEVLPFEQVRAGIRSLVVARRHPVASDGRPPAFVRSDALGPSRLVDMMALGGGGNTLGALGRVVEGRALHAVAPVGDDGLPSVTTDYDWPEVHWNRVSVCRSVGRSVGLCVCLSVCLAGWLAV